MILVKIDPDSTRDDLVTCALSYCDQAKLTSRLGRRGTDTQRYCDLHETLDALTDAIRAKTPRPEVAGWIDAVRRGQGT